MVSFAGVVLAVAVVAGQGARPYDGAGNVPGVSAQATGFFRVERIGRRWTVIDPLGHGFVPLGVDHVSYLGLHCEALGYAPYHEYNKRTCPDEEVWMDETAKGCFSGLVLSRASCSLLGLSCRPFLRLKNPKM